MAEDHIAGTLLPMTLDERRRWILADLQLALEEARTDGFEETSERAVELAKNLLAHLTQRVETSEGLELAIGEDGSIEVDIVPGDEMIIVMIAPSGSRMDVAVQNWKSGEIVSTTTTASNEDIVRRIERAA